MEPTRGSLSSNENAGAVGGPPDAIAPSSVPRTGRVFNIVLLLAAFLAGFAVISIGVRYVMSAVGLSIFDVSVSKPREAARQRADFIFVGPSHFEMGIIPNVFDTELSRYATVRSYNLAIAGLSVPELDFLLKRLLALDNCCVKYVVFYPAFEVTTIARERPTARSIDYFNLSNAIAYLAYLKEYKPATPAPHLDLSDYAAHIVSSTVQHYLNLGMALRPLELTRLRWGTQPDFQIKDMRGYVADERALTEEQQLKTWRVAVDDVKVRGPDFQEELVSDRMFSKVMDVIATIERQGAKAIIVRPPAPWHWPYGHAFIRKYEQECPQGPPVLDFGDPVKYPVLFEGANRYDASHLNTRGATIWSRLLADQIGELIRSGRLEHSTSCDRAKT